MLTELNSGLNIILLERDNKNQNVYIPQRDWKFLRVRKHETRGVEIISQAVPSVSRMGILWDHTSLLDSHQNQNRPNNFWLIAVDRNFEKIKAFGTRISVMVWVTNVRYNWPMVAVRNYFRSKSTTSILILFLTKPHPWGFTHVWA